ncbi:S24 family peptidase [Meiothermus sp. CFH 77666]|uniref:S24 family peptidase n=1 Tax=Meiothermus sp. CFH 77666 TaxID=2817942 RepID=UPI001AA0843D|nr:S24 family peptidase [Meiothermus sp. CFH 77666]MBO1437578.1 helix-turn-helix domain-containing protein [Meiothermus sp. CFH 77666]
MLPPHWATAIRQQRLRLGLSQTQVAQASGLLNQTEVSRLERGLIHPTLDLGAAKLRALLSVLGWSLPEFSQATGLQLAFVESEVPEGARRLEAELHFATFPVQATASAGHPNTPTSEGLVSIPLEDLRALGVQPENVRVFAVNGDCMVSESVRAMGQSIAPGDRVAVDTGRMPRAGDVVVAWDGLGEVLLIKRYREEGEHIVFYPARRSVPPVVRHRDDPVKIIGPVVWRGGPFRG